ncbi:hypothetical protein LINGRAHAP2_LOCUS14445 [Linum grandiflorum]
MRVGLILAQMCHFAPVPRLPLLAVLFVQILVVL